MTYSSSAEYAALENAKLHLERTTYKANKPIVDSLKDINQSLDDLKNLMSDVLGIMKHMDLNAYGQHRLQQAYEQSIIDGEQG